MSVTPASNNAWDSAREILDKSVFAFLEKHLSAKYFEWIKVGEPGDETIIDFQALDGKEGETRPHFEVITDELNFDSRQLRIGWTGKETEISIEKIRQINKIGGMASGLDKKGNEVAIAVDKLLWQGATKEQANATINNNGITIYGLSDAGDDKFYRPTILDGGAPVVKWDVAGGAAKVFNALKAKLMKFPGPYALFYPEDAEAAFGYPMPTAAASFGEGTIKEYASKVFDVVAPVGNDLSGNCIMTGGSEDETDFQIFGVAMGACKIKYTQPIESKSLYDEKAERGTHRVGCRAIPVFQTRTIGGTEYKGVVEVDSQDLYT